MEPQASLALVNCQQAKIVQSAFEAIIIENDVLLSSGAKVLCSEGTLRVRKGSVIGANAVLLNSTGEGEIWAGIPAKLVGHREIS